MTRIANKRARPYRSELRAQQAEETRGRILDATVRVMARGLVTLSIPDVAREAGVSVPTVYRHFRTKHDLVAAVYPHVAARAGINQPQPPGTVEELREGVRSYFASLDALDDAARAAMAGPASDEIRRITMPNRVAIWRRFVDSIEPAPSEADRDRITRLLTVLTSSASQRMWNDHLGASVDQAADDIEWVIRAAVAATKPERER
jgi:AcrR family transcriptional regulator